MLHGSCVCDIVYKLLFYSFVLCQHSFVLGVHACFCKCVFVLAGSSHRASKRWIRDRWSQALWLSYLFSKEKKQPTLASFIKRRLSVIVHSYDNCFKFVCCFYFWALIIFIYIFYFLYPHFLPSLITFGFWGIMTDNTCNNKINM